MTLPTKCSCCEGAGSFLTREAQCWPNDGRQTPSAHPVVKTCHRCNGSGKEPRGYFVRSDADDMYRRKP